jgi:uncharacterized DUF497 family protein
LKFEWSPSKAKANFRKHGIAFDDAIAAFEGPRVELFDDDEAYGEERIVLLGEMKSRVIVIVYNWRGEKRRIISARTATKQERAAYYAEVHGSRPS